MADPTFPLKMVTDRIRSCKTVIWVIDTQGERALKRLDSQSSRRRFTGDPNAFRSLFAHVRQQLSFHKKQLEDAHQALLHEKGQDGKARKERDDAKASLGAELNGARSSFIGVFGNDRLEELGFSRVLPTNVQPLLAQARQVSIELTRPDLDLSGARSGIEVDPVAFVEGQLQPARDRLEAAEEAVETEARLTQLAIVTKDDVMAEFNREFPPLSNLIELVFLLAGFPRIAARVRPSRRQPGLTSVRIEEGDETVEPGDEAAEPTEGDSPPEADTSPDDEEPSDDEDTPPDD